MTTHSASYSQKYTEITPITAVRKVYVSVRRQCQSWSEIDHFGFSIRNVCSAQNQFPVITQAGRMVNRTGKPVEEMIEIAEERESSSEQIRTLFNEQRKTIIAECC